MGKNSLYQCPLNGLPPAAQRTPVLSPASVIPHAVFLVVGKPCGEVGPVHLDGVRILVRLSHPFYNLVHPQCSSLSCRMKRRLHVRR